MGVFRARLSRYASLVASPAALDISLAKKQMSTMSNNWELVKTIAETVFYGLSAGALIWQRAAMSGGIHAKLDQLLSTQERQDKKLNTVGHRLQSLWRAVRTLRRRVTAVENRTPPVNRQSSEELSA